MASPAPFRFLASVQAVMDGPALAAHARRAESIGYDALVVPDHLAFEQLSPIPTIATILAATSTLRSGPFVLNNDLRHPAVLAHELASIDVLSGGRLDVAMGAGWRRTEYDAIGRSFDPQPTRVARLAEAIAVLKGCFTGEPFDFAGEHYSISELVAHPKPVQHPHPRLMIGGGGQRTLSLAAREADIVGLAPRLHRGHPDPRSFTLAATEQKLEWIRAAAGDRYEDLEFCTYPSTWPVTITDDRPKAAAAVAAAIERDTGVRLSVDDVIESPHLFVGSVEEIVDKLLSLRERFGITTYLFADLDELAPVVQRLTEGAREAPPDGSS